MPARTRFAALAALVAVSSAGCSSGGGLFGPAPAHRLLPEAHAFRCAEPPAGPRELAKVLHPPYVVEPGDVLLVQPVEFDSPVRLSADQPVLPDGTIDLGRFGRPVVAGKILPQIEAEIQPLVKDPDTNKPIPVTVRLISRVSKVFYVLGEVNAPGSFILSGRETVLDAITLAGGLTRQASENSIVLARPTVPGGCRVVLPVCYKQIVQLGDTTTNYQVMAGDRIYVPSKKLLESLLPDHHTKKDCPVCVGNQFPCPGGTCEPPAGGAIPSGVPVVPWAGPAIPVPTVGPTPPAPPAAAVPGIPVGPPAIPPAAASGPRTP